MTGGALFGGTYPLVAEQSKLGRKLAVVRMYFLMGQHFGANTAHLMAAGTTVLASLDIPRNRGITYGSIVAGRQDALIRTWLTELNQDAVKYHLSAAYVSFEHEANAATHKVFGTPAEFVKAWDHIHALAAKAHLNAGTGGRLRWALILEHYAYFPASMRPHWSLNQGMASQFWPGTANVNVVAADGYNWGGCRLHKGSKPTMPSVTPGSIFNPVLTFAQTHGGLPVFLAEWASAYYSAVPAWQAHFINEMKTYVQANRKIVGASYWDSRGFFGCNFAVTGHAQSVSALKAMGHAINGHVG